MLRQRFLREGGSIVGGAISTVHWVGAGRALHEKDICHCHRSQLTLRRRVFLSSQRRESHSGRSPFVTNRRLISLPRLKRDICSGCDPCWTSRVRSNRTAP